MSNIEINDKTSYSISFPEAYYEIKNHYVCIMKKIILLQLALSLFVSCSETKDYFTDLPSNADPVLVSDAIIKQLLSTPPEAYEPKGYDLDFPYGNGTYVHYAVISEYVNALQIESKLGADNILDSLALRVLPFIHEKSHLQSIDYHVDFSIFGAMPLEIVKCRPASISDADIDEFRRLGLHYADHQWEIPDSLTPYVNGNAPYKVQMRYYNEGYSPQTRLWIDDMYMINVLQTQAYRVTGDKKYIKRAAKEMTMYIDSLQQPDGLFFHSTKTHYVWGRGAGWMAAGMPMILQYLEKGDEYYQPILDGYRKMMEALLKWQRDNGLWGQIVTDPESWDESSSSAMFAFGFIMGIQNGWIDSRIYGPAARKAWISLCDMLDEDGNMPAVCQGTNAKDDRDWYLNRKRVNGDPHGQAPMLWICNALIKADRH